MAYDEKDHSRALMTYRDSGRNMSATQRITGVSQPILRKWRREGLPHSITGGKDWDTFLDEYERRQIEVMEVEAEVAQKDWLDDQKKRLDDMLETIYRRITRGEGVEIKAADYDKLLRTKLLLENREKEKLEWMNRTFNAMLLIAAEIMDQQQLALFQSRLLALRDSEAEKMDLLPGSTAQD